MNKCFDCDGKCCVGDIEVYKDDEIYENTFITKEIKNEQYERVMRTNKNNKCIAFINHMCAIYNKRPNVCRRFEYDSECCKKFRSGEKIEHKCVECILGDKNELQNIS